MHTTKKDELIAQKREYATENERTRANLAELKTALKTHTGKLVDKRFFLEHFKVEDTYRDWTRYSLRPPRYDWSKHNHELYVSKDCTLELENRETSHIMEHIERAEERARDYAERLKNDIAKLEGFDEDALVKELRALYHKYGAPEHWNKILDSYEVKYPEND